MLLVSLSPGFIMAGLWSGHSDGHSGGYFSGAADDAGKFFLRNRDRAGNKLRDAVSPEAGVVMGWVFLWQQQGFMGLAFFVNVAQIGPGKCSGFPFAAEGNPPAVTGPTVPGFALVAVDIQAFVFVSAIFFGGFKVYDIEVAAVSVNWKATVIAHAEQQPAAVRANPGQQDA